MQESQKGVMDLGDRVLKELLKKPAFKENVRTVLQNIDPDAARRLVRTLMWQDPEFFLGLLGAVPALANALVQCIDELLIQLNEKFSPQLLHDFLKSLVLALDKKTLESVVRNGKLLGTQLWTIAEETYNAEHAANTNTEGQDYGN
ncbi:MAG TPA: hypothetical protein P5040_06365 [Smithella sp.]|nr:hypothetical protein [Smithella sp.]HRS97791.1 hypothetical protein [Smithella sp.]